MAVLVAIAARLYRRMGLWTCAAWPGSSCCRRRGA